MAEKHANRLLQIAIVVEDVDKAYKTFTELLGFEIENEPQKEAVNMRDFIKDYEVNGEPSQYFVKQLSFKAFNLEWEIMQPVSGSPMADWLKEHGPGIHHLAFMYEEGGESFMERFQKFTGNRGVWMNGTAKSIGMDYNYLNLFPEIGFMVEAYREDMTPKKDLGVPIDYKYEG